MTMSVFSECPTPSDLAAYMEGGPEGARRREISDHLLECVHCYEVVTTSAEVLDDLAVSDHGGTVRPFRRWPLLTIAASLLLVTLIPLVWYLNRREASPLAPLIEASASQRITEARIAEFRYAPFATSRGASTALSVESLAAAAEVEKKVRGRDDAESRHARAIVDLTVGRTEPAVAALENVVSVEPSPRYFSDLAAAYLQRGAERRSRSDFVDALEAAERALEKDASFAPALFNRALALESQRFLNAEAIAAWEQYLRFDDSSEWATEARRHLSLLKKQTQNNPRLLRDAIERARLGRDSALLVKLSAQDPESARAHIEDVLLPLWARSGDSTESLAVAETIAALARGLPGQSGSWAADVAGFLRASDGDETQRVARGIACLAETREAAREGRIENAAAAAMCATERLMGTPLAPLATILDASVAFLRRTPSDRLALSALLDHPCPSISGRAHWLSGLTAGVVDGRHHEALQHLTTAANRFDDAGEVVSAATARAWGAQALEFLGDEEASWRARLDAASTLHAAGAGDDRASPVLFALAEAAERRGCVRFASLLADTLFTRAASSSRAERAVDALTVKARASSRAGDAKAAVDAIATARDWAQSIRDERTKERTLMFVDRVAGEVFERGDPARAHEHAERALARARSLGDRVRENEVLLCLARVSRMRGDDDAAERYLRAILQDVQSKLALVEDPELRLSFSDTAAKAADELIDLLHEARRSDDALSLVRETRSADLPGTTGNEAVAEVGGVVIYSVLADRTLVWVEDAATPIEVRAGAARLEKLVASFRRKLDDEKTAKQLYALLVAPVARRMKQDRQWTIVPDKALHLLPFAALRNPETGRYFVEERSFEIALAPRRSTRSSAADSSSGAMLVIADPAVDASYRADYPSLRGAASEADVIAALHRGSIVLRGDEATRRRFLSELSSVRRVHFAGHGTSGGADRRTSVLFMAPDGDDGVLYARELELQDLSHVELFVLAGCRTGTGRIHALHGLAGVARAALAAGAQVVVATLADVVDTSSAQLFTRMHSLTANGHSPSEALRTAQVEMLRSDDRALRDPAGWGVVQVMTAGL